MGVMCGCGGWFLGKDLHHKGSELEPTQDPVRIGVVHILKRDVDVVLCCHVVRDVVIEDQT